jgi:hypothetical protein
MFWRRIDALNLIIANADYNPPPVGIGEAQHDIG